MSFGLPTFLFLLVLIPVAFIFILWTQRRRHVALQRLGDNKLISRLSQSVNQEGRRLKMFLWLSAFALVILALARPQWGADVQVVSQEGIQLMLALDVSRSMLAEDVKPNRLTRAKLEISELLRQLEGDEIGLVLFAGTSFIQFPLTSDYGTARSFLESAKPGAISSQGTNLSDAIETAMQGFNDSRNDKKIIIIMTDGENHNDNVFEVAQKAAAEGAVIYTFGLGSHEGQPIPNYNEAGQVVSYVQDNKGQVVLSRLDEISLGRIADITSGQYFRVTSGGSIAQLTANLSQLEKQQLERRFETQAIERFQIFVLLAILILIVAEYVPERRVDASKLVVKRQRKVANEV